MEKLSEEITKILIFSNFEQEKSMGKTAAEINSFQDRAIDYYNGICPEGKNKMLLNLFKARIDRDVALIIETIANAKHTAGNRPLLPA